MGDELSEVGAGTVAHQLSSDPGRNLALELVRVTEAAAIAAGRHMGRGDKELVDQAAVDAMRPVLHRCRWTGSWSSARARRTRRRCSTTASAWAPGAAAGRPCRRSRRRHDADGQACRTRSR